jgi:predicted Zn-ribbon and HTH transcriptional regulator
MKALKPLYEFKELKLFIPLKKCKRCGYEYEKQDYCPKCGEKETEGCIGFRF